MQLFCMGLLFALVGCNSRGLSITNGSENTVSAPDLAAPTSSGGPITGRGDMAVAIDDLAIGGDMVIHHVDAGANKFVFVSSQMLSAALGGLDGADQKCQMFADAVNLGGTYKAWLSNSSGSPSTRFVQSTVPYVLVTGELVANDWTDLTTNWEPRHPIDTTEQGTLLVEAAPCTVFTDTFHDGTIRDSVWHCGEWVNPQGAKGVWGSTNGYDWTGSCGGQDCETMPSHIFCFEQ